jgi:hypothetical protein
MGFGGFFVLKIVPNLNTKNQLNTQAKAIDIKSVNDSTYTQSKSSPKSLFSRGWSHIFTIKG